MLHPSLASPLRWFLPALLLIVLAAGDGRAALAADAYAAPTVDVDVTAESAAAAREQAVTDGQRKALAALLQELAPAGSAIAAPQLSDGQITDMVEDFEVESERASDVRYIGKLAFRFKGQPVRDLLARHGVVLAPGAIKPVLVLPVLTTGGGSQLWSDTNGWLAAWAARPAENALEPVVVPLGDLADVSSVDAAQALAGDIGRFAPLAARYGTDDTVVAEARLEGDPASGPKTLTLLTRRYGVAGLKDSAQDSVSGDEPLDALYAEAIERVKAQILDAWKKENLVGSGAEQHLSVAVPITQLSDWLDLRRRLGDIPVLRQADLRSLTKHEARLDLVYLGDQAHFAQALAQRDLTLTPGPDLWVLHRGPAPAGQPAAPAQPPAATVN